MNWIPQNEYNNFLKNMVLCCVDVCIVSENGVLLVLRNTEPAKNQWWFPGGRIFKYEKLKDCAKRKCIEEVNLICNIGPIIQTEETIFDSGPSGISIHSINVCFLAIPHSNDVRLDKFSNDFKWIQKIESNLHPYVQKCLAGCGLN